jgi:hypothetical protein
VVGGIAGAAAEKGYTREDTVSNTLSNLKMEVLSQSYRL